MNKHIFRTLSCIFILGITFNLIAASPFENISFLNRQKNETLVVLDSDSTTGLPDRYRDIPNLNISGSAQFTNSQIKNLKNAINKPNICIVDLRQESHGLVNDYAISFFNPYIDLNNGFTTEETIKKENSQLNSIKIGSSLNIYHKTGKIYKTVTVDFVSNESVAVTNESMQYKRYAVRDNSIPSPTIVDEFVSFVKTKPTDLHLHFHCDAGEGRTTTFMVMYQTMMNDNNLSLDQILAYQYNIGGINLNEIKDRREFLIDFYNYISKNKSSNYDEPYSQWIKEQ